MGLILKISGAGNRFLLVDQRWFHKPEPLKDWSKHSQPSPIPFEDFIALSQADLEKRNEILHQLLSQDSLALADGLIVLRESPREPFVFDFYNKDGSKADMCGNAVCCLAFYLRGLGLNVKEFFLGNQKVRLDSTGAVILDKPTKAPLFFTEPFPFYFIDTGVPHGVIPRDKISFPSHQFFTKERSMKETNTEERSTEKTNTKERSTEETNTEETNTKERSTEETKKLKEKAQALRFKNIGNYKKGMNVSFYQALSNNHLKARTFERGVEDFTLACGTGALAVTLTHKHISHSPIAHTPSPKESIIEKSLSNKESSRQTEKNPNNLFKVEMPGGVLTVEIGEQLKLTSEVKKGF